MCASECCLSQVLGYLANHGPSLQQFVIVALVSLLARITKLGWFENPDHSDITKEVGQYLSIFDPALTADDG